eukprot:COSAG01_NODE_43503_length_429_cov_0.842424_1_plen_35_part_10
MALDGGHLRVLLVQPPEPGQLLRRPGLRGITARHS